MFFRSPGGTWVSCMVFISHRREVPAKCGVSGAGGASHLFSDKEVVASAWVAAYDPVDLFLLREHDPKAGLVSPLQGENRISQYITKVALHPCLRTPLPYSVPGHGPD